MSNPEVILCPRNSEKGSIESTAIQLRRLLGVLTVPDDLKRKLLVEFNLEG